MLPSQTPAWKQYGSFDSVLSTLLTGPRYSQINQSMVYFIVAAHSLYNKLMSVIFMHELVMTDIAYYNDRCQGSGKQTKNLLYNLQY